MTALLLTLLAAPDDSVRLTFELVSSQELAMHSTELDAEIGAYRIDVTFHASGSEGAHMATDRLLVMALPGGEGLPLVARLSPEGMAYDVAETAVAFRLENDAEPNHEELTELAAMLWGAPGEVLAWGRR